MQKKEIFLVNFAKKSFIYFCWQRVHAGKMVFTLKSSIVNSNSQSILWQFFIFKWSGMLNNKQKYFNLDEFSGIKFDALHIASFEFNFITTKKSIPYEKLGNNVSCETPLKINHVKFVVLSNLKLKRNWWEHWLECAGMRNHGKQVCQRQHPQLPRWTIHNTHAYIIQHSLQKDLSGKSTNNGIRWHFRLPKKLLRCASI